MRMALVRTASRHQNGRATRCWINQLLLLVLLALATSAMAAGFQIPKIQEPEFHPNVLNLAQCGGVDDGRTPNTEVIAKAIASLAAKGGGTLVVPPGIWLTGPIRLQGNI